MSLFGKLREAQRGLGRALETVARVLETPSTTAPPGRAARPSGGFTPGVVEIRDFGSNPGRLRMLVYSPPNVRSGHSLAVILHGCAQDAVRFAADSGWMALADRCGIPLVLPEQVPGNNRGRCFNWFRETERSRGDGEASSIREMISFAAQRFATDPGGIFIVGLSAGGAMAASLMAAYPEVFSGGAIVAGLPVGCASTMREALERMARAGPREPEEWWAEKIRHAAPRNYRGAWPRVSIWHGEADPVVDPANAQLLATQWRSVHGLSEKAGIEGKSVPGVSHRWWGPPERPAVELWMFDRVGHAYPIRETGRPSEWVAQAAVSATEHLARAWRLCG